MTQTSYPIVDMLMCYWLKTGCSYCIQLVVADHTVMWEQRSYPFEPELHVTFKVWLLDIFCGQLDFLSRQEQNYTKQPTIYPDHLKWSKMEDLMKKNYNYAIIVKLLVTFTCMKAATWKVSVSCASYCTTFHVKGDFATFYNNWEALFWHLFIAKLAVRQH